MQEEDLCTIGDRLIDTATVKCRRVLQMNKAMAIYKKSTMFLGYCSQLSEYSLLFGSLTNKLMMYRKEIITRYKDVLMEYNVKLFKTLLIPPSKTYWFTRGIAQYKKMQKYCVLTYRKRIQETIDSGDKKSICDCIDTVIAIDKFYDVYADVIDYFIDKDSTFAEIMLSKYTAYIQL